MSCAGQNKSEFSGRPCGVVSAYSTCGLSMGLTPDLSIPGRIVICLVMFVGRMGPLFLISAVAKTQEQGMWYAEEDIMVG